jgi:hypothetical protein
MTRCLNIYAYTVPKYNLFLATHPEHSREPERHKVLPVFWVDEKDSDDHDDDLHEAEFGDFVENCKIV